jgi:hypothetical protein
MRLHSRHALVLVGLGGALALTSCGGPSDAFFPEDYASTYVVTSNCVRSLDHDSNNVIIYVSPEAVTDYCALVDPLACVGDCTPPQTCGSGDCTLPEGTMIVKEEYAMGDATCANAILRWSAMRKDAPGSSPDTNDWTFQSLDKHMHTNGAGTATCLNCHQSLCEGDVGWFADATCRVDRNCP